MATLGDTIDTNNPEESGGFIVSEDWEPRVWIVEREWYTDPDTGVEEEASNVIYRDEIGRQTYRFRGKTLEAVQDARDDIFAFVPTESLGYSRNKGWRSWCSNDKTSPRAYDAELTISVRYSWRNNVALPGNTLRT